MGDITPMIKCKKCRNAFQPEMKTKKTWQCPSCQAKNPNLKRHYRSVADLCILGLIVVAIRFWFGFSEDSLNFGVILSAGQAILLLVTVLFVYKSKAPWADSVVKVLIWTVFGLALLFNVVIPLVFFGWLNIPACIVYALVFPYLFWLNSLASKCTAAGAPSLTANHES